MNFQVKKRQLRSQDSNPLTRQNPPISLKWKEFPTVASADETMMEFISENADDLHKNTVRKPSRPKGAPITRNEDFLWTTNTSKTV